MKFQLLFMSVIFITTGLKLDASMPPLSSDTKAANYKFWAAALMLGISGQDALSLSEEDIMKLDRPTSSTSISTQLTSDGVIAAKRELIEARKNPYIRSMQKIAHAYPSQVQQVEASCDAQNRRQELKDRLHALRQQRRNQ